MASVNSLKKNDRCVFQKNTSVSCINEKCIASGFKSTRHLPHFALKMIQLAVFSGRRKMWPNNEWRLSAIRDGRFGSFVLSLTTAFNALDTLSCYLTPRIRRSAGIWKDWILSLSTLPIIHVSDPYCNTTDTAGTGQKFKFVFWTIFFISRRQSRYCSQLWKVRL